MGRNHRVDATIEVGPCTAVLGPNVQHCMPSIYNTSALLYNRASYSLLGLHVLLTSIYQQVYLYIVSVATTTFHSCFAVSYRSCVVKLHSRVGEMYIAH
jgi:hypothetical protein